MKTANVVGQQNMPMNIWGQTTLLLGLLYREGLLPQAHIFSKDDVADGEYFINGIRVGKTLEEVTTCVWFMVESYAAEGHIDFQDNATVAERHNDALCC